MHVSLLDPKYLPLLKTSKMNKGGLYEIKVEEVEVETQSVGKPSSPHADSPGDSQWAQSSTENAQMQPAVDPYDPLYAQISITNAQTKRWSQFDTDQCDPP